LNLFLTYIRGLDFEEKPDYSYLKKLLKDALLRRGHDFDYKFDWVLKKDGKKVDPNDMVSSKWEESKTPAKKPAVQRKAS
jgi:hypothetical protein